MTVDNETTVRRVEPPENPNLSGVDAIGQFLTGLDLAVKLVKRSGKRYYRLSAIGQGEPSTLREINTKVINYRVTAYVTQDGLVRTLVVAYDRRSTTELQHVYIRLSYVAVGSSTVTPPDWAPSGTADPVEPTDVRRPTPSPKNATAQPVVGG